MAEVIEEYVFALARELVKAKVLESAVDDITVRVLRDRPSDIGGYLESCKAALPSYFERQAVAEPVEPSPGEVDYNKHFIQHIETIAGSPTLATATAAHGELRAGQGQAPQTIRGDDPAYDKKLLTHLADVASGAITAERKR